MRTILIVTITLISLAGAQDWTHFGFKAEPGVAVGTPCILNATARFWYRNFGIGTCGIWLPPGFNLLNGSGIEGNLMYKLILPRQPVQPYVALGYGASDIRTNIPGGVIQLVTSYGSLQVGAYYQGAFAQVGVGYGRFKIANSPTMAVWPLLQIGYVGSIGGSGGGQVK